jgi:hypothetical protein
VRVLATLPQPLGALPSHTFTRAGLLTSQLPVRLAATLDGRRVELIDLSLTGARVAAAAAALCGDTASGVPFSELRFDLHGGRFRMRVTPRRRIERDDGQAELGLEFDAGQDAEIARLAIAIFQGQAALELVDARPTKRRRRVERVARGAAA